MLIFCCFLIRNNPAGDFSGMAKKYLTMADHLKLMEVIQKARLELDSHPKRMRRNLARIRRLALKIGIDPDAPLNLSDF